MATPRLGLVANKAIKRRKMYKGNRNCRFKGGMSYDVEEVAFHGASPCYEIERDSLVEDGRQFTPTALASTNGRTRVVISARCARGDAAWVTLTRKIGWKR